MLSFLDKTAYNEYNRIGQLKFVGHHDQGQNNQDQKDVFYKTGASFEIYGKITKDQHQAFGNLRYPTVLTNINCIFAD